MPINLRPSGSPKMVMTSVSWLRVIDGIVVVVYQSLYYQFESIKLSG